MNTPLSIQVAQELITFVKGSSYYNKFQITFDRDGDTFKTETFYHSEGQWGHSIFREGNGGSEPVQDVEMLEDDTLLIERLTNLSGDAQVVIASNSPDFILSIQ